MGKMSMNDKLIELYKRWINQLDSKFIDGEDYSNPYYCGIPKDWENGKIRLMICGEEGVGSWHKTDDYKDAKCRYDEIERLQSYNLGFVDGTMSDNNSELNSFQTIKSFFWKRFKQFEYLSTIEDVIDNLDKQKIKVPVIWNECDKICYAKGENGNLDKKDKKDRKRLHQGINIMLEEIKILKPTHIIFLGWHFASLNIDEIIRDSDEEIIVEDAFPDYCWIKDEKNPYGKKGRIKNYAYPLSIQKMKIGDDIIKVYYLYHPQYGNTVYKAYNEDITHAIEDILND